MTKYTDIANKTYGKLTAIKPTVKYTNSKKRTYWIFQCVCGKETERLPHIVISGHVTSCGCSITSAQRRYFGEESIAYLIFSDVYSDGDLCFSKFVELIKQNCYYCNASPNNRSSRKYADGKIITLLYSGLDRLDSNLPHDQNNVVPCCINCNKMKSSKNVDNFLKQIEAIYKHRIWSIKNVPTI